jgi:adenylate cyclase
MTDGNALERGMLRSDLLRTALFCGALVVTLCANAVAALLTPYALPPSLRGHLTGLGLLLVGAAGYELAAYRLLAHALRAGAAIPGALRYVNALVETSFPTVVLVLLAGDTDPVVLLHGPTPYIYFLLIVLSTLHLDARVCVFTGALAAAQYGAYSVYALGAPHTLALDPLLVNPAVHVAKAGMLLLGALAAGFIAQQLRLRFTEALASAEAESRVVAAFGQHVSPAVVERILAARGDEAGELRRVCVMFLDVRDFTAFASGRPPAAVMAHLNLLFGAMIETINAHHGIINKFLGDGFMAVFGAPLVDGDACRHAVDAALEIVRGLDATIAAGALAPTRIGIGLHTGDAMTGSVGSARRKEYTVIGEAVNLAARIEGLTKQHDARVLASEAVWRELPAPPAGATAIGVVPVRGVADPVAVYKLA